MEMLEVKQNEKTTAVNLLTQMNAPEIKVHLLFSDETEWFQ